MDENNADGSEDTLIDRLAQLSTDTTLLIEVCFAFSHFFQKKNKNICVFRHKTP